LDPQLSGSMVRFIETRFDRDRTGSAISELLPDATNISVNPMSLREIFVALARGTRT
jgi:hypothetical protein